MPYYRAYQSKEEAQEAATHIRKPGNSPRGYRYPLSVTVQPVKNACNQWLWAVYYYQREPSPNRIKER